MPTTNSTPIAPVFRRVFGQDEAVKILVQAADLARNSLDAETATEVTHAWLFVGPPGSGRSTSARAFAAALQCAEGGCGACATCRTIYAGTHADVRVITPAGLSVGVEEMRALVVQAATAPVNGGFQILIIEDADRLTEAAANALLKAVEEPPPRTIFLLCAPSLHPDDIPMTIRSRCRVITLRTPSVADIAAGLLDNDGVDVQTGAWAAAVTQRHVGRARRLATDPEARERRTQILALPRILTNIGACFDAAQTLMDVADAEARNDTSTLDEQEIEELTVALGGGGTGKGAGTAARGIATAKKELAKRQKSRATRAQRDALDRALVDLAAFYRDVLLLTFSPQLPDSRLVHIDLSATTRAAATRWSPESVVHRINAILACRQAIAENVKPRIAIETMCLLAGV